MKSGSIIASVLACTVILFGSASCAIGVITARVNGQSLFTEKKNGGTYFAESVSDSVTKLRLELGDVDITVCGGAKQSKIEFYNFNPNRSTLSTLQNIITFEEVSDENSAANIWERILSFKGLRYALDIRNFGNSEERHRVDISLSDDCSVKNISIVAADCNAEFENISISGDIDLSIDSGEIKLANVSSESLVDITGETVRLTANSLCSDSFDYSVSSSEAHLNDCEFNDCSIYIGDGRVDFISSVSLAQTDIDIRSTSGGILVNSKPQSYEYIRSDEDTNQKLKIQTANAGINLEFPTED